MDLKPEDLKLGATYRAKRFRETPLGNNDRIIIWMGKMNIFGREEVQYDSDTVKNGRNYPIVTIEEFLKWAKEEVKEA